MVWIKLLIGALAFALELLKFARERDEEKRRKKKEALDDVKKGLAERDPSLVTAGFDRLRRVR